jgi:hypothetical protein
VTLLLRNAECEHAAVIGRCSEHRRKNSCLFVMLVGLMHAMLRVKCTVYKVEDKFLRDKFGT